MWRTQGHAPMKSVTAVFLAWVLAASAQQPPVPAAPQGVTKFQANTQLVVEDLILKDKIGNAITGLKPSDFIVTEDSR